MKKLIAAFGLATLLATSAHANLLTNGSFEADTGIKPPAGWSTNHGGWSNGVIGVVEAGSLPVSALFPPTGIPGGSKVAYFFRYCYSPRVPLDLSHVRYNP